MFIHALVTFIVSLACGLTGAAQHAHHQEGPTASTSALGADQVRQLLEGEGMGLAKPAELNHYPGPRHVLELRTELGITPDQERQVAAVREEMLVRARALGRRIVEAEQALDAAFRSGEITEAELARQVGMIARLQGELRLAHLRAHVLTRPLLTVEQVRRYYELRRGHGH
ncbi:MAG TPA: hypothetical protein VM364_09720 [Vicinamibacterales bacterium]|nr:hypothetical protein [Vicinamibacterales bacterium]